jgi:hypothetical protein
MLAAKARSKKENPDKSTEGIPMLRQKRKAPLGGGAQSKVGGTTMAFAIVYTNRTNIASATVSELQRMAGVCLSREELAEWINQEAHNV